MIQHEVMWHVKVVSTIRFSCRCHARPRRKNFHACMLRAVPSACECAIVLLNYISTRKGMQNRWMHQQEADIIPAPTEVFPSLILFIEASLWVDS